MQILFSTNEINVMIFSRLIVIYELSFGVIELLNYRIVAFVLFMHKDLDRGEF